MLKTKLTDYETQEVEVYNEQGEPVRFEVRSMASREFKSAVAEYREMLAHAKDNDIPLTENVKVDQGLGIETESEKQTEFARKAMAILLSSLVVEWPLDSDIKEDLLENEEVAELIDATAAELSREFHAKKKI